LAQYLLGYNMRGFKYLLIIILFSVFAFASCKKSSVSPTNPKPVDTDALIHEIKFSAPSQFAATSVSGTKLTVIYYENVSLLVPAEGLNLSYSIHLKEYFSSSILVNFNFTTEDAYGDVTYDWVDDNLNNVTAKTEKDTTISGVKNTEITVQRPFTFARTYTTSQAAILGEDSLLNRKSDKILFASYVYFTKTYPADSTASALYYVKTN
jgi:hypothetical protein